jgi:hypothetical protein
MLEAANRNFAFPDWRLVTKAELLLPIRHMTNAKAFSVLPALR